MKLDLEKLKFTLKTYQRLSTEFGNYSKIYLRTTENISGYLNRLDIKGKKILLPAASGEHLLNAYSYEADDVCCYDINPLAFYQTDLKVNCVRHLSLDEYLLFYEKDLLNYSLYEKVAPFLCPDTREFYDYLYQSFTRGEILDKVYYPSFTSLSNITMKQNFINPLNYEKVKHLLKAKEITHLESDLFDLKEKLEKRKYDLILTSNISDYIEERFPMDVFKNYMRTIHGLSKSLNKNGQIQMAYVYNYLRKQYSNYFLNEKSILINRDNFKFYSIDGYDTHASKDGVLVWQKAPKKE